MSELVLYGTDDIQAIFENSIEAWPDELISVSCNYHVMIEYAKNGFGIDRILNKVSSLFGDRFIRKGEEYYIRLDQHSRLFPNLVEVFFDESNREGGHIFSRWEKSFRPPSLSCRRDKDEIRIPGSNIVAFHSNYGSEHSLTKMFNYIIEEEKQKRKVLFLDMAFDTPVPVYPSRLTTVNNIAVADILQIFQIAPIHNINKAALFIAKKIKQYNHNNNGSYILPAFRKDKQETTSISPEYFRSLDTDLISYLDQLARKLNTNTTVIHLQPGRSEHSAIFVNNSRVKLIKNDVITFSSFDTL